MVELVTRHNLDAARREHQSAINRTRRELEAAMDNLGLPLTVRMGVMLAAGLTLLGAVSRIHPWTLFALMRRLFVVFAPSEPCRLR